MMGDQDEKSSDLIMVDNEGSDLPAISDGGGYGADDTGGMWQHLYPDQEDDDEDGKMRTMMGSNHHQQHEEDEDEEEEEKIDTGEAHPGGGNIWDWGCEDKR